MKLIATDLDGTLLQPDSTISKYDLEWINKAENSGIKVIVATGRQYTAALELLSKSKFKPDYIITDNGSCAYSVRDNKKICSYPIKEDTVKEILDFLESNNYPYSLSSDEYRIHLKDISKRLTDEFHRNKLVIPDLDRNHLDSLVSLIEKDGKDVLFVDSYRDILNLNTDLFNISALSFDPNRIKNGIAESSKIKGVNVVSSAYNNFEFQNHETSKGKALSFIADHLNISLDDTMAIGDNYNDVSMFEHAYHSVAMGNSNNEIKSLCKYTTLTNLESGVGHAIKTFALNK